MVSIHEEIASHFVVEQSSLETSFIKGFAQAVRGEIPYDSSYEPVEIWEDFLITWLNGGVYEDKREYMKLLLHTFRDEFSYEGDLYRGMVKEPEGDLYPMHVASFSSRDEVAFYFAGCSEEYGTPDDDDVDAEGESVIIRVYAEKAFAFDDFLRKIESLTQNEELSLEIQARMWEEEKIFPLPEYLLDGI